MDRSEISINLYICLLIICIILSLGDSVFTQQSISENVDESQELLQVSDQHLG